MYDFFVIGDIMIDHIGIVSDPDVVRSVDESSHSITLPFPTKIQMNHPIQVFSGGNAFNALAVFKKLGANAGIYSVIGNDPQGKAVISELTAMGVDISTVVADEAQGTNKALILNIANDRVVFSHHYKRNYNLPNIPDTKYVYLTSLGEDDKNILTQVVAQKQQKNFQLIFSPGTRQITEPFADIRPVLEVTDILILNKREAKILSRLNTDSDENLLQGIHKFGPKMVVITRSGRGSIAFDGQNYYQVGALKTDGFDATGAGDTYSASMAMALSLGKDIKTAMEWGAIHSSQVISAAGGNAGLIDAASLEKMHSESVQNLQYTDSPVHDQGLNQDQPPQPTNTN